jgi:uncharacterized integral membrane protein
MGILRFTIGLIFLLVVVMYSVQNLTTVSIGFYNHHFELHTIQAPVIIVICFSILAGFILSWLVNISKVHGLKSLVRKQRKEIKHLTKLSEKKDLRIAALTESAKPVKKP